MGGVFLPNADGLVFYAKQGPKGGQAPGDKDTQAFPTEEA